MASQANQALPEGTRLDKYRIVRTLAAGGFSIVYLAHDDNDAPVVIKEYLPSNQARRAEDESVEVMSSQRRRISVACRYNSMAMKMMVGRPILTASVAALK